MSFSWHYIHAGVVATVIAIAIAIVAAAIVVVVVDNVERRAGKFIDANFPVAVLHRRGKELLSCQGSPPRRHTSSYPILGCLLPAWFVFPTKRCDVVKLLFKITPCSSTLNAE